jgi:hypothetical protein
VQADELLAVLGKWLGIAYAYESTEPASAPGSAADSPVPLGQRADSLPADVLGPMREALAKGSMAALRSLAANVESTHPALSAQLQFLARTYDYSRIDAILNPKESPHDPTA